MNCHTINTYRQIDGALSIVRHTFTDTIILVWMLWTNFQNIARVKSVTDHPAYWGKELKKYVVRVGVKVTSRLDLRINKVPHHAQTTPDSFFHPTNLGLTIHTNGSITHTFGSIPRTFGSMSRTFHVRPYTLIPHPTGLVPKFTRFVL